LAEKPFSHVQAYEVHLWPQPHFMHLPPGSKAIDAFIGEPEMLGHGSAFLRLVARPLAGFLAVKLLASPQDRADVGLRRLGKPISCHVRSTAGRRSKVVEMGVQVLVLDLGVVAAIECRDALLDRKAQLVQLERFLCAALLQRADGVAQGLAGVAVFACLQHFVDEGVLFGRQADIAGRHGPDLTASSRRWHFWQQLPILANPLRPALKGS
jgi:hypothetical protein